MINYIPLVSVDVITYLCVNSNADLAALITNFLVMNKKIYLYQIEPILTKTCLCIVGTEPVDGFPDSKVHGANMGPTWVLSAPRGPHVGPITLVIRVSIDTFFGICMSSVVVRAMRNGGSLFNMIMMTSSNGNIFRVTGPLCGEFPGFLWSASE